MLAKRKSLDFKMAPSTANTWPSLPTALGMSGIGSGVDVVCVGGTKSGDVDGRRLIPGHGEVRCIGRLGVEAARRSLS